MQKSALISAARARLDQAGDLVGLALDTGTLLLTLAQGLTDEERKREVETAEQLFLAVQGVAGDSPMFRLGLARVHYWLGRPEQGRALLEELVAEDEDALVHLAVARTLREVGAQSDAIGLAERVWQTSPDEQVKRAAAGFLSSVVGDLDQRLTWGERSDPQDPGERASLLDTKALRSLRDGDLAAAEQQLRAAAELYRGLPPRSATLNNHALVAGRLFVISGRAADLDLQIDLLLQAERLEQGNSVIKSNLVWALMERAALRTLAREGIDMGALRAVPGAGHLDWACADAAGLARVTQEWQEEPDLKEIHTRLRALRVLAPRDPDHHLVCLSSLGLGRDLAAHQELVRCLEGADLDLALASRSELSSQAAARAPLEEREQVALRRALELRRARLDALPSDASPATRAMGRTLLLQTRLAAFTGGEPVELDPLVAEGEALLREAPSLGALDLLGDLYLERALTRATPRSPALKAMRERTGRALGADLLVPLAMEGSSEVRELLATDPDLQRAAALIRRRHAAFPADRRPRDWALLRALGTDDAELAALTEAIGGDQILALRLAAYLRLNPLEPRSVTSNMWLQGLKGDREAARAVLDRAVQAGMVFPYTY